MNIVLCGFMGCGKTTCGELLSARLGYPFIDTDAYIERKTGRKISDIFAVDGEPAFRLLERETCAALAGGDRSVIATGGGALCDGANVSALRKSSLIFFLDAPLEVLLERLRGDKSRPLLRSENLEELYAKRIPLYKAAADYVIDGSGSPYSTVEDVLAKFGGAAR